ncbi:MAG: hypothetical protein Kow00124_31460 [Anaerolineae bacterium]
MAAGVLTYAGIGLGLLALSGLVALFITLIRRAEMPPEEDREDAPPAEAVIGGTDDIPRVPEDQRQALDTLRPPEITGSVFDYLDQDLEWRADPAPPDDRPRYVLQPRGGGPLLGVMVWATRAPLYAVAWIGGRRFAIERRGTTGRPRLRVHEAGVQGRLITLKVEKGRVALQEGSTLRWRPGMLSSLSRFADENGATVVRFDASGQRSLSDNTTLVQIEMHEYHHDYIEPLLALGFFELTPEP